MSGMTHIIQEIRNQCKHTVEESRFIRNLRYHIKENGIPTDVEGVASLALKIAFVIIKRRLMVHAKTPLASSYPSIEKIAIFWDIENCCIPANVSPEDVYNNIITYLKCKIKIDLKVISISAYADLSRIPEQVQVGLRRYGVELIDTPKVKKKKDTADKAIMVAMFEYADKYRAPSSIMLITGDVDFASTLHALHQRGHNIIVAVPSGVWVSSTMKDFSDNLLYWSNVVRGEDLEPALSLQIKEGKMLVEQRISRSVVDGQLQLLSLDDVKPVTPARMPVPLKDLTSIKGELVELLDGFSGSLHLSCLAREYRKKFNKGIRALDYGSKTKKLIDLLEMMSDVISVSQEKVVMLKEGVK